MGANASAHHADLGVSSSQPGVGGGNAALNSVTGSVDPLLASNEHFFGLINFGNTCYCNSVLQSLYYCRPFREQVLAYRQRMKKSGQSKDHLLACLADLFHSIATQKRRVGTIAPKRFITKLKKENELFDNYMQQDAHEFLNYLLNTISEILAEERKAGHNGSETKGMLRSNGFLRRGVLSFPSVADSRQGNCDPSIPGTSDTAETGSSQLTWVQEIFQGVLTNETRCLNCETLSSKDESFLDLSVDVEPDASITHCLRAFSDTETLQGDQKYYCETCCSKQEAQKRMRIKRLPRLLALHLKRFKYVESLQRHTKLSHRVLFPLELRLFNVSDSGGTGSAADQLFDLLAAVVHCGATPNRGHYITLVRQPHAWLLFDDDVVDKVEPSAIEDFFGLSDAAAAAAMASGSAMGGGGGIPVAGGLGGMNGPTRNSESAYILFYLARNWSDSSATSPWADDTSRLSSPHSDNGAPSTADTSMWTCTNGGGTGTGSGQHSSF